MVPRRSGPARNDSGPGAPNEGEDDVMTLDHRRRSALGLPHEVVVSDRIPKERYYDPEFFALEAERLWPRVWQMACRLEEIPHAGDFVEYDVLDRSVVVVRDEEGRVRAFENSCRHRGVKVVEGCGTLKSGFTCPFHGWCYGLDGVNTFISKAKSFSEHNLEPGAIDLVPVRCEVWGGCAWINLNPDAPPLRSCIEPFATILDAWKVESMRAEWWHAFRLPVNWKLAQEAFLEQYHVIETHPELVIPKRFAPKDPAAFDPEVFIDAELHYLHVMSEGMGGMVHANDVAVAERQRTMELPKDPDGAMEQWHRALNDAVVAWHTDRGADIPDLNELEAQGIGETMYYCFPHYFVLPMYSSASAYRFRPLGPEETHMEIWSLTRYPEGQEPPVPARPEVWAHDDPRVPPIPTQDFSNLPRQQRGLHNQGFEFMRLSQGIEGGIANFERTLDGYLAGLSDDELAPALREVNVNPLERPVVDLGF
jgi:phenylpropionate dioxygenase-like ring-hydroxylating dioxygenase large terminal subunit